jgi:hypothetical protein
MIATGRKGVKASFSGHDKGGTAIRTLLPCCMGKLSYRIKSEQSYFQPEE